MIDAADAATQSIKNVFASYHTGRRPRLIERHLAADRTC